MTNDTWGLNFTSPIDAKQFRECCVSLVILYLRHAFCYIIHQCHILFAITLSHASPPISFLLPGSRARKLSGDDLGATHNKSDTVRFDFLGHLQSLVNFPYSHRRSRFQGKRPLLTRWSSSHRTSRRSKRAESRCRHRPHPADPGNLSAPAWRRNSSPDCAAKTPDIEVHAVRDS